MQVGFLPRISVRDVLGAFSDEVAVTEIPKCPKCLYQAHSHITESTSNSSESHDYRSPFEQRLSLQSSIQTIYHPERSNSKAPKWDVRILYDGECPLCLREIDMLKKRDNQQKISFVNIATSEYEPLENGGITYGQAMGRIHGVLPDGKVIRGVEVFRRCYEAVGLGWVYAMTAMKPIERVVNFAYDIWARYRLPLTGRQSEGIDRLTYWNEAPLECDNEEYCELSWEEESEDENKE